MSTYNWGYNPLTKWDEPPSSTVLSNRRSSCECITKKRQDGTAETAVSKTSRV